MYTNDEPDEEDIYLQDDGFYYIRERIADYGDDAAVARWMEANHYWPNVWVVSDHGNVNLYTLES